MERESYEEEEKSGERESTVRRGERRNRVNYKKWRAEEESQL